MRVKPALLLRQQPFLLEEDAESHSDASKDELMPELHWEYANIVFALDLVPMLVQNTYHGIGRQQQYLPVLPHPLDHMVELPGHGRVMTQPEFQR